MKYRNTEKLSFYPILSTLFGTLAEATGCLVKSFRLILLKEALGADIVL